MSDSERVNERENGGINKEMLRWLESGGECVWSVFAERECFFFVIGGKIAFSQTERGLYFCSDKKLRERERERKREREIER